MSSIEYDLSTDDSDDDALNLPGLANNGVPGLLVSVEFDDTLSDPVVENGKVRMPRGGGSAGLVQFGGEQATSVGMLAGMEFATGISEVVATSGLVYFPLAEYTGYYGTTIAGAIVGACYATGITEPRITNGMVEFPEVSGETIAAAEFDGTTTSVTPGGLKGAAIASYITQPRADSGVLYFPVADTVYYGTEVAGGVWGASYASGITEPRIYFGEVQFPLPGDAALQGVVGADGSLVAWDELQGAVGSQATVATVQLQVSESLSVPLSLAVGLNGAYLTFNLYNA